MQKLPVAGKALIAGLLASVAAGLVGCDLFNASPIALFSWSASEYTVEFDASDSHDTDGSIVEYLWNFGDGRLGSRVSPAHTYSATGPTTHRVWLAVTDDKGATSDTERWISIAPSAPEPAPPPPADNSPPVAAFSWSSYGSGASFDAADSSDPDDDPLTYAWSFGDGLSATGRVAGHVYFALTDQEFVVRLTVSDPHGASDAVEHQVLIEPRPTPKPGPTPAAGDGISLQVTAVRNRVDILGGWAYLPSTSGGQLVVYARNLTPGELGGVEVRARAYDANGDLIGEGVSSSFSISVGGAAVCWIYWWLDGVQIAQIDIYEILS
jgi:hypothetical protein